jgi:hypothetical protein
MEYNAIFEIRRNLGYVDENTQSKIYYDFPKFFAANPKKAIRAAYNIAKTYISENPDDHFIDDICVKIIEIKDMDGCIDQKSADILGQFEDDCIILRHPRLDRFFDLSRN